MNLQSELLKSYLSEMLSQYLQEFPMDMGCTTEYIAVGMLEEIKNILENISLDDFEKVEAISAIFRKRRITVAGCHDF
ncbi:MAG: hypothetical protein J6A61_00015 [Clostridia bacterium]|nr:hypothetical protein [Clostridia bacterium]